MTDIIEMPGGLHPAAQAAIAGGFTWAITAAGAALVLLTAQVHRRLLEAMEGFAAGVMLAASYWSLLAPALELSSHGRVPRWLPPAAGVAAGALGLWCVNRLLPHLHPGQPREKAQGLSTTWNRHFLLMLAITLHNIPEGLAVGVAFGGAAAGIDGASMGSAVALAVGIGLQNLPEGMAVAFPMRKDGASRGKSFFYGQASALVEPVAAVAGALAVTAIHAILPYALGFAAGAMLFVVIEELIPDARDGSPRNLATLSAMAGFVVMMILDVALG